MADDIDAGGCALQSGEAASVDAIDFRGSAVLLGRHALHTREGFFKEGEGDGAVGVFGDAIDRRAQLTRGGEDIGGGGRGVGEVLHAETAGEEVVAIGVPEIGGRLAALTIGEVVAVVGRHIHHTTMVGVVVHRVGSPKGGGVVHVSHQQTVTEEVGMIPSAVLTILEDVIFLLILRIADDTRRGSEVLGAGGIEGDKLGIGQLLDVEPAEETALVGRIGGRIVAVVHILSVVHQIPVAHGADGFGDGGIFAGVVEVGQTEGVGELVAEEPDAVEVGADGHVSSVIVYVIVLEQLVSEEEGGDRHRTVIDGEGGAGGEARPEIVLITVLAAGVLTGTGIHHADHGDFAGGGELRKVHCLGGGVEYFLHELLVVRVDGSGGSISAIVGVGLRESHLRHDLEGRREQPVAHLFVVVCHRAF